MMPDVPARKSLVCYGSLIALGMMTFWQAIGFDFLNWDDPAYVLHNDLIRSWTPQNLFGVATQTVTRNYAPLTIFSLLIDHSLWGLNPAGYHATNILLHIANGVLVFLLLRQLTGSSFVAWTTAALFLVHPVQVETVAWISSRKGLLSAFFMLSALLFRLKPNADAREDGWYVACLAAALLSKALAVVLPPIVLLYDLCVRREKPASAIPRQIIPGVMCLLLLLKTMASQHTVLGGIRTHLDFSIWHIMAVDTTILWRYIGMLFYPSELCVLYDPPVFGIWKSVLVATLGWIAVAVLVWRSRVSRPLVFWAALCFLLLLFPVLNFFRITTLMNDRYLYLPCIIVFALVAGGLESLFRRLSLTQKPAFGSRLTVLRWPVAATLAILAASATWDYLPVWKNPRSLWTHAMQTVPQLPVVRIQMAFTQHDLGLRRQAVRTLQQTLLETNPDRLDRRRILRTMDLWSAELAAADQRRSSSRR